MAVKKWVPIVFGIVIFFGIVGIGLVGGLAFLVSKQVKVQNLSEAGGREEFDRLAARFAGQTPFIEMPEGRDGEMTVHHELETHETGSVKFVHVHAWSPRERKLVQADLPFWLMRLGGNHPIELHTGSASYGAIVLSVTPEQIDRRGPGLILSSTQRRGDRLLIWSE